MHIKEIYKRISY